MHAAAETPEPHTNGHHRHASQPQLNRHNQEVITSSNGATHKQQQHQEVVHHPQQPAQQLAGPGRTQQSGQSQEDAAASRQLVDALFAVLQQPLLPSTCVWQIGWLLSQLLANAQSGTTQLLPHHQKQLEQVRRSFSPLCTLLQRVHQLLDQHLLPPRPPQPQASSCDQSLCRSSQSIVYLVPTRQVLSYCRVQIITPSAMLLNCRSQIFEMPLAPAVCCSAAQVGPGAFPGGVLRQPNTQHWE